MDRNGREAELGDRALLRRGVFVLERPKQEQGSGRDVEVVLFKGNAADRASDGTVGTLVPIGVAGAEPVKFSCLEFKHA